jgi:hypothetical protein
MIAEDVGSIIFDVPASFCSLSHGRTAAPERASVGSVGTVVLRVPLQKIIAAVTPCRRATSEKVFSGSPASAMLTVA